MLKPLKKSKFSFRTLLWTSRLFRLESIFGFCRDFERRRRLGKRKNVLSAGRAKNRVALRRVGDLGRRNFSPFKNFGVFTMAKKLFFALVAFVAFTASANFVAAQEEKAPEAPAVAAVEVQAEVVDAAPCDGCEAAPGECQMRWVACRGLFGCIKYRLVCDCDCCAPCCKPVCCAPICCKPVCCAPICCKPVCVKVVRCCVPVRCCAPVCAPCCL